MFKTVADLTKDGRLLEDFDGEAAPLIEWRDAKEGSYYYPCQNMQGGRFMVRAVYIVRAGKIRGKRFEQTLAVRELQCDGESRSNEFSDFNFHKHWRLWPMTAKEVTAFKRAAKKKSAAVINDF